MPVLTPHWMRGEGPDILPLEALARQLLAQAPPLVSALVNRVLPSESFGDFVELVTELVTDHRAEILAQHTEGDQIAVFANHFQDDYFPLPWFEDSDSTYHDLLYTIPIMSIGIDWDGWHDMPWRATLGNRLLAAMVDSPFEYGMGEEGGRIPLVESCRGQVPDQLLARLTHGYPPTLLHLWLDDTRFSGAAVMADMLWHDTGSIFLDIDDESMPTAEWSMENVLALTEDWLLAQRLEAQVGELAEWLEDEEASPADRFRELLDFIDQRRAELDT
jgi:hypothetical protein